MNKLKKKVLRVIMLDTFSYKKRSKRVIVISCATRNAVVFFNYPTIAHFLYR